MHDPDIFFPERGKLEDVEKARWTCFVCPVSQQCEEFRVRTDSSYGIWNGKFKEKAKPKPVPVEIAPIQKVPEPVVIAIPELRMF